MTKSSQSHTAKNNPENKNTKNVRLAQLARQS